MSVRCAGTVIFAVEGFDLIQADRLSRCEPGGNVRHAVRVALRIHQTREGVVRAIAHFFERGPQRAFELLLRPWRARPQRTPAMRSCSAIKRMTSGRSLRRDLAPTAMVCAPTWKLICAPTSSSCRAIANLSCFVVPLSQHHPRERGRGDIALRRVCIAGGQAAFDGHHILDAHRINDDVDARDPCAHGLLGDARSRRTREGAEAQRGGAQCFEAIECAHRDTTGTNQPVVL